MKKYFAIGLFSIFALLLVQFFYIGGLSSFIWAMITTDDTLYTKQYSYSNWRSMSKGLSQNEVTKILGKPLDTWERNGLVVWSYAISPGDTHHHVRQLYFNNQKLLVKKYSSYYID